MTNLDQSRGFPGGCARYSDGLTGFGRGAFRWLRIGVGIATAAGLLLPAPARAAVVACTSAAISTGGVAGAPAGTAVQLTVSSTGCSAPEYRFFLQPPGGSWTAMTAYAASDTWTWSTSHGTAIGTWGIGVWARQQGSPASYEAYSIATLQLDTDACASVTLTDSGGSLTANALCPSPVYRFWMRPPGGAWTILLDWQTSNTASFTGPGPSGIYEFGVWARDAASTTSYDSYAITTGVLGGCQVAIATTGGMDTPYVGQTVSVSAGINTACPAATYEYQYWLLPPGGSWTVEQAYSTQGWWSWSTAGFAPGVYQYGLWVKSTTSPAAYDAWFIGTITLMPGRCGAASIATSPLSPQVVGNTILLQPSSAGICGGEGFVKYWILPPNSSTWTVLQEYSLYNDVLFPNSPSYSWSTTGLAPGPYRLGVWFRASSPYAYPGLTSTYDSYAIVTFWLQ